MCFFKTKNTWLTLASNSAGDAFFGEALDEDPLRRRELGILGRGTLGADERFPMFLFKSFYIKKVSIVSCRRFLVFFLIETAAAYAVMHRLTWQCDNSYKQRRPENSSLAGLLLRTVY